MGELIKFQVTKQTTPETPVKDVVSSLNQNVFNFKGNNQIDLKGGAVKACLLEGSPRVVIGGQIIVELLGKKYIGTVTDILQKDKNNNVTKIGYTIPFLSSSDPFKFGEADFTYKTETHD